MANPSLVFIVGAKDDTGAVLNAVTAHMDNLKAQAGETGSAFEGMGNIVRTALGTIGASFGIAETVAKMKEMVTNSVALGMEIGHLAEKTGISTQTLSGLKYVSDVTGVAFESLQRASKKLSTEMLGVEESNKASIKSFARLGISEDEVRSHSNDLYGMLEILANKFEAMPDGPQKAAIAVQLLGKTGMDLIPILNQGSAGLAKMKTEAESLGLVLDASGVAKLQEMHKAGVELDGAMQGLALSFTNTLGPSLIGAAELAEKLLAKLRELRSGGVDTNTSGYGKYIPKELSGIAGDDLKARGNSAQAKADAAQAEYMKLDALHVKGAEALKANNAKKLALQKEYYAQSQAAAAAHFLSVGDNIAAMKVTNDKLDGVGGSLESEQMAGIPDVAGMRKKNEDAIQAAMALQAQYGHVMQDASNKSADLDKKPGPGLILQDEGGRSGKSSRDKTPAESPFMRDTIRDAEASDRTNERISQSITATWNELNKADEESARKQEQVADELARHQIQAQEEAQRAIGEAKKQSLEQEQRAMEQHQQEVNRMMQSMAHDAIDPLIEGTGTLGKRWQEVGRNVDQAIKRAADNEIVAMLTGVDNGDIFSGRKGSGRSSAGQGVAPGGLMGMASKLFHPNSVKGALSPSGGGAPTVQIINQSSQPVSGTASSSGGDGSGLTDALTPHVVTIILSDLERGGSIAQALGGGGIML